MQINCRQAAELLQGGREILILCHKNPDGDTLGAGYGLYFALREMGKSAQVLCSDPVPAALEFLQEGYEPLPLKPDLVVAVDLADTSLMGRALEAYKEEGAVDLCIDHHLVNTGYAKNTLLQSHAAATCQVVYQVLQEMKKEISPKIAACLYTGIATDTGCFRYPNTEPSSHRIAAELMERGIDFDRINQQLFRTKSRQQIQLEQLAMRTLEYACDGRMASISVTDAVLKQAGATLGELEDLPNLPCSIEGVQIGATFKEVPEGGFKVSLRTVKGVDALQIAQALGGGGHRQAAGCLLKTDLETAKRLVQQQAELLLKELDENRG